MADDVRTAKMTDDQATAFMKELEQHAKKSAQEWFEKFLNDDEQLSRGPRSNDGFNDFLREKGMNWTHFEEEDHQLAHYASDRYIWHEGYEYRQMLVRRYREAIQ